MYEELIPALATATRIACLQPTDWESDADVDADIFGVLAGSVRDPGVAGVLRLGPRIVRELAITAGPAADGIIANSNRRLLAHLRAADADAAEYEMDRLLRCLHLMWRLARCSSRTAQPALRDRRSIPRLSENSSEVTDTARQAAGLTVN